MNFNAKGKGPLELPRLTSIGPGSTTSDEIGELVFRGGTLSGFNEDEFSNNRIDGREINVWYLDSGNVAKRYGLEPNEFYGFTSDNDYKWKDNIIQEFRLGEEDVNKFGVDTGRKEVPIADLADNGLIARHVQQDVTGGLTTRLGASITFSGGRTSFMGTPLVLFLERNRIPTRLTELEYTQEFKQNNPVLAGAADNGSNMLVVPRVNHDYSLGDISEFIDASPATADKYKGYGIDTDGTENIVKWYLDPVDGYLRLASEHEIMAHSSHIDLDHSLFAVCHYTTESKLNAVHSELFGDTSDLTVKKKVKMVHEMIANDMKQQGDRLVTCLLNGNVGVKRKKVGLRQFNMLYDGSEFTKKYDDAAPFTDPLSF